MTNTTTTGKKGNTMHESKNTPVTPPSLNDLMLRFVTRAATAESIEAELGAMGDVQPHEVAIGFRVDPRLAWGEALTAAAHFATPLPAAAPAEWSALVIRQDSAFAMPWALGCYPQRVRDLTTLLQAAELSTLRPHGTQRPASAELIQWANRQNDVQAKLLAASLLRAADDLTAAGRLLDGITVTSDLITNERAALAWQQGNADAAVALWKSLPVNAVALFNLGMAALFMKQPIEAAQTLRQAVALIPEGDGWHHLANLYLSLAEMQA